MEDTRIPEDPELDAALRDYFRAELDGQLGRAAARFGRHLRGPGSTGSGGATGSPPGGRAWGGWVVGVVGGAMAASIAGLWAGPALFPAGPAPRHGQHAVPVVPVAHYNLDLDDVTLTTQTRDGGTVLLDGRTPARRIVRNELKQVRWVDSEQNVSFEKIEPRQTIMLIEMDTY